MNFWRIPLSSAKLLSTCRVEKTFITRGCWWQSLLLLFNLFSWNFADDSGILQKLVKNLDLKVAEFSNYYQLSMSYSILKKIENILWKVLKHNHSNILRRSQKFATSKLKGILCPSQKTWTLTMEMWLQKDFDLIVSSVSWDLM